MKTITLKHAYISGIIGALLPLGVAAQAFPSFPMSFWGNATVNGNPVSVGAIVRAYYGDTLAGEVTVIESGTYGFTNPTKNKLVAAEGVGEISFRIFLPGGTADTEGLQKNTHSGFQSGATIHKYLQFTIPISSSPTPTPIPTSAPQSGSSSGGGGGGDGYYIPLTPTPSPTSSATTQPTPAPTATQPPSSSQGNRSGSGQVLGVATYQFTSDLSYGTRNSAVTELQKRLTSEIVYSGPITGYFGAMTRSAVISYQAQNGLNRTGIVDAKTRAALNGASTAIAEGALIRAQGDIDVYIVKYVGAKQFKRLILSPSVFNNYGHLRWEDITEVESAVRDSFTTSELVRAVDDARVYRLYPSGDTGEKRWIASEEAFRRLGFDLDAIYEINAFDRDSYITGQSHE